MQNLSTVYGNLDYVQCDLDYKNGKLRIKHNFERDSSEIHLLSDEDQYVGEDLFLPDQKAFYFEDNYKNSPHDIKELLKRAKELEIDIPFHDIDSYKAFAGEFLRPAHEKWLAAMKGKVQADAARIRKNMDDLGIQDFEMYADYLQEFGLPDR